MNGLAKIEVFKNSKYFVDFLRVSDPKKFKEMVKFGEKIERPTKFESILNMEGVIKFINEPNITKFETLIYHEEPIYEKIKE